MEELRLFLAHTETGAPFMLCRSLDQSIKIVTGLLTRSDHPKNIESSVHINHFTADSPA